MRIAITGPLKNEAIAKAEQVLNTQAKHPSKVEIMDYAAETYKYQDETHVIFEGSPFDFLALDPVEGYAEVEEQICMDTLANVNYVAVIVMDMDKHQLDIYKEFSNMFPDKFYFYSSPADFEVRLM